MKPIKLKSIARTSGGADQSGFTLIELMIGIVIIGILVAIAMPAYTSYTQKARRTDAKTALLDLASREEKFFTVNNQYTNDATQLYGASAAFPMDVQSSSTAYYQLSAPVVTAATTTSTAAFTAQAVPIAGGPQASDACGTFQITNTGATSVTGTMTNCW